MYAARGVLECKMKTKTEKNRPSTKMNKPSAKFESLDSLVLKTAEIIGVTEKWRPMIATIPSKMDSPINAEAPQMKI
jgi:hypothetical protein